MFENAKYLNGNSEVAIEKITFDNENVEVRKTQKIPLILSTFHYSTVYFNGLYASDNSSNACDFEVENGILHAIGRESNTSTYNYQVRGYID